MPVGGGDGAGRRSSGWVWAWSVQCMRISALDKILIYFSRFCWLAGCPFFLFSLLFGGLASRTSYSAHKILRMYRRASSTLIF